MSERIDASFEPESGYLFAHVDPERVKALMMECGTSVHYVIDLDHAPDPHGRRVLTAIDQLRRDLSGYHGQLKAHSNLQVHCDRQRERIACLEGLYKKVKTENAKLREELGRWEQLTAGIELPDYPVTQFKPKDLERENERLRSCLADADENARQIMGEYGELEAENERLRKKLEFERENNGSMRRLFDAVAPRCGKPDCPSLVEYVEKLRELVRDMVDWAYVHDYFDIEDQFADRMRELGIEVD